jgi:hypothetical protein
VSNLVFAAEFPPAVNANLKSNTVSENMCFAGVPVVSGFAGGFRGNRARMKRKQDVNSGLARLGIGADRRYGAPHFNYLRVVVRVWMRCHSR